MFTKFTVLRFVKSDRCLLTCIPEDGNVCSSELSVNICRDDRRHILEDTILINSSEALCSYLHLLFPAALKLLGNCTKQFFFAFIEDAKMSFGATPRNFQAPGKRTYMYGFSVRTATECL
jgi:hypothetical protein